MGIYDPPGITQGGLKVLLAGQDITAYVDESSIDIKDTLGQGPGSGSGASTRASTCSINTSLGPLATAPGSGSHPSFPYLVRGAEIQIYDINNNCIYGGYATKYTDKTDKKQVFTAIECHDYWQQLDRIIINEVFSGRSDVYIIKSLLNKYAPWVDTSNLPSVAAAATFTIKNYRNVSLQKAIQDITNVTGFQIWIDPYKRIYYVYPGQAQTAPFALSTSPDFRTSFQYGVDDFEIDDNAVINRVYFYGGRKLSNDFTQDVSTQVNGVNKVFVLAYYPRQTGDGKIHVKVNGVDVNVGYANSDKAANTFVSQGGTANVLINADARNITFDTAPASGSTVSVIYRYESPMVIVVTDEASRQFFGQYYDGFLSDETVFDVNIAIQRSRVLLLEQSFGLKTLKCRCWRSGLQSGMVIQVDHSVRNIHASFIIQEVDIIPYGNGFFEYYLTLGAWNWNMVDIVKKLFDAVTPTDDSANETTSTITAEQAVDTLHYSFTMTKTITNFGGYYARSTAVADGHDAYCGFCSITS